MKVLFRMLASILPGIVVGLGVIAYLEREHLMELWSGEPVSSDEAPSPPVVAAVPQNTFQAPTPSIDSSAPVKVEAKTVRQVPPSDTEQTPLRSASEPEPEQKSVQDTQSTFAAPDLAEVVGLEPVKQQEKVQVGERAGKESVAIKQEQTGQPMPASQASQLAALLEQQRRVAEVLEGELPALAEKIASLSKPIEDLAKQFDPASGQSPHNKMPEHQQQSEDVWEVVDTTPESEIKWLWSRGRQAYWEGDYDLAIESYRSLLQEDPKNPDAWGELGNIYYAKRDWVRSVRAFSRAAVALYQQGRVSEAEKITAVIRVIDPEFAMALQQDFNQR